MTGVRTTENRSLNPDVKAKWLSALRDGGYIQGREHLERAGKFCCLGVLRELTDIPKREGEELLDDDAAAAIGLSYAEQQTLAGMNDDGNTFHEIADYIEANL